MKSLECMFTGADLATWVQVVAAFFTGIATCVLAWFTSKLVGANKIMASSAASQARSVQTQIDETRRKQIVPVFRQLKAIGDTLNKIGKRMKSQDMTGWNFYEQIREQFRSDMLEFSLYVPIWLRSNEDGDQVMKMQSMDSQIDALLRELGEKATREKSHPPVEEREFLRAQAIIAAQTVLAVSKYIEGKMDAMTAKLVNPLASTLPTA